MSRATAMGVYSVLLGAGQLIGNLLGGWFAAPRQMDGVLALTALLATISLGGTLLMGRLGTNAEVGQTRLGHRRGVAHE